MLAHFSNACANIFWRYQKIVASALLCLYEVSANSNLTILTCFDMNNLYSLFSFLVVILIKLIAHSCCSEIKGVSSILWGWIKDFGFSIFCSGKLQAFTVKNSIHVFIVFSACASSLPWAQCFTGSKCGCFDYLLWRRSISLPLRARYAGYMQNSTLLRLYFCPWKITIDTTNQVSMLRYFAWWLH